MHYLLYFYTLLLLTQISAGAKILFLMGLGSHSHRVAMQPLATNLADRGHDITFVSARKSESGHPRIKEVCFERPFHAVVDANNVLSTISVQQRLKSRYIDYLFLNNVVWDELFYPSNAAFLEDTEFVKFVRETRYNLIISDFVMKETGHAMSYIQGAKLIWFNSAGVQFSVERELLGLPMESSWLPDFSLGSPYAFIPNYFVYTYSSLWWYFSFHWHFLPKLNELYEKTLGAGIPTYGELVPNVDLVFLNEHFSFSYPTSLPPFVIPIGGMHCKNSNGTLPKKLEDFIEPLEEFVFVSFGSIINVTSLPAEMQAILYDTVGSFPNTRFLWKWEGNVPENMPKNVLAMDWFPQQDVLAHPKCKGFVTQGGAMSFQQGIYHGVPMVIVPVWWDQPSMARSAVEHGVGIHLELSEITRKSFHDALAGILYDKKYSETSKLVSKRSKDRPMSPVETAVWWTEYVLRHDTAHLKSPAIKQRWWQRRLLDFWLTVLLFLFIVTYATFKALKLVAKISISRRRVGKNRSKVKTS